MGTMWIRFVGAALITWTAAASQAEARDATLWDCDQPGRPIVTLDFGSPYNDEDPTRSKVDPEAKRAVREDLDPLDDFVRAATRDANRVLRLPSSRRTKAADCLVAQLAVWARQDALGKLQSFNANLSVGARIAGLASAYEQVRAHTTRTRDAKDIEGWLHTLAIRQRDFWEKEATRGARSGNLRAWAALGVETVGDVVGDDGLRLWAAASIARVLCTAETNGALPQEMRRGGLALHYQIHAVAPLAVTTARLERGGLRVRDMCGGALERVARFAMTDYENGGTVSAELSGAPQILAAGATELEGFQLAWLPAYLTLFDSPRLDALAAGVDTLSHSMLGGNQTLLWSGTQ